MRPVELLKTALDTTARSGVLAPRQCSPASSNGTLASRGRHSGDGAGHHGYGRRACHLHRHPCHKELCASTTSTAPTTAAQSPAWKPSLVLVNPSPQPSSPSPAPVRTPMKTQVEPRALHSYYIKDMARNYATDCSDFSLEEDEAVRTHGLSPSEKRESVRLHHEDEAPCPRDRGSPTTTPCSTLKYI